jgi:hypothetical protein
VIDTVTIQFDFSIGTDGAPAGSFGLGDGMGMMLETNGKAAVGGGGGLMGISPLSGYGVEISEYDHQACLDNDTDKIGIDSLASCDSNYVPDLLTFNNSPGVNISDGNWHTMVVTIDNGAFAVTVDGHSLFSPSYAPAGWTNGSYYLGFGGGTGGAAAYHRVRNVHVTYQTPHCY